LKKMQRSFAKRKNDRSDAGGKPIVAPIADGSGSLPRAIVEGVSEQTSK